MNPRLHADITQRLDRDFQFKETSGWLRQGTCHDCKKKSLYTHAETPWVIKCERLNKCGAEYHVKELYPELFEKWSERHPVTPENPNAAADAYLAEARGFDLTRIAGWYQQDSYYDPGLKMGSATVRFPLPGGYWERLIDEAHRFGSKKAHFKKGSHYGGTLWMPGNVSVMGKDFWIVEGIFDAIALHHHDLPAGSAMSCNNYPETTLKAIAEQCAAAGVARPRLVWALDGDKAGQGFTRQWVKKSREAGWVATAAQIPQKRRGKLDWNDMHQRDRLKDHHIGPKGLSPEKTENAAREVAALTIFRDPDTVEDEEFGEAGLPGEPPPVGMVIAETEAEIRTLTVGRAVAELDMTGYPVVLFRNAAHGGLAVVYRRPDGNVGWIDPQRTTKGAAAQAVG